MMQMADWARSVSRYQTANWLTPLPATINWESLVPLAEDGSNLQPGQMRPYQLYTGRQLVHLDQRWSMQESRELFEAYSSRLRPVDTLYERIFKLFKQHTHRLSEMAQETGEKVTSALGELKRSLDAPAGGLQPHSVKG